MAHYISSGQLYCHRAPSLLIAPSPSIPREGFACRQSGLFREAQCLPPVTRCQASPMLSEEGTISIKLNHGIIVTIALDGSVHLSCQELGVAMSVSGDGTLVALLHPTGKVFRQETSEIQVVYFDEDGNTKMAKLSKTGVSFTSKYCPLLYHVDPAGVRTKADYFLDLDYDITMDFVKTINNNTRYMEKAWREIQKAERYQLRHGGTVWTINGIRIEQNQNGITSITVCQRGDGTPVVQFRPEQLKVCIRAATLHCTASYGSNPHLFVRRGEERVHSDVREFQCRSGSHAAGFNDKGQITVFK